MYNPNAPSKTQSLTFEKYKSFKWVNNIKDHYKVGKELGSGSFGSVFATENI